MNLFNYLYADSLVAFKVVCLHRITLSEMLLPLPRTWNPSAEWLLHIHEW